MSAENKLNAFLQADKAPARDPAFVARLEERMARIRFGARLRWHAVIAIAVSAILYGLLKASGLNAVNSAAQFATDMAGTPGLALAAIIVTAAVFLPRILPTNLIR